MKRIDLNLAHSAQGVMNAIEGVSAACGTACGSGDKQKATACGTACGSGDKQKATACGMACGSGDKK